MPDFVMFLLVLHLPALVICGMFFAAGGYVSRPKVRKWLRVSAVSWLAVLWSLFTAIVIAMETCGGNMLYGYTQCTIVPTQIANLSVPAFVLGVGAAVIYGVVLAITATLLERQQIGRDVEQTTQ